MKQIHIAPNKPLYVALVDPEGQYDFELRTGRDEATCRRTAMPATARRCAAEPVGPGTWGKNPDHESLVRPTR